uniref:Reverse transcriptase n=1 Tax=Tanacetum cinerariifolium TaxID=118510 RepID=A0A699GSQ1_TANCI|nr:reverse transcriptase [Tanacetum cinerariifolium]
MGTLVSNLLVSSDGLMDVPVEMGELIPSMNSPRVVVVDPKQLYTKLSRVPVWDAIINRSSRAGPCLVIGDVNLIGELSDKVRACPFQSLLHKPIIGIDHAPLIYCSHPTNNKKKSRFRFESMWTTHIECENTIQGSWPNFEVCNQLPSIKHKLSSCASKLKRWSQNTFGNNRYKIENLTRDIKIVQTLPHTPSNFYKQRMLLQELETIWLREEMFCHQRSRVNWLKYGDCNSRFFHVYAIQRGQKNKISRLKTSQGEWVYDNGEVQRLVRDHFGSIFTTNGARNYEEVISVLNPVVSETMNLQLQSPITYSKIHKATKQLEGLKAPEFIVNGDSIGFIKPQRGLRQGDPISPYLFIIVADVLSRQISKTMALGSLSGIKMDRACPVVSHILFSDDFLFFLKASHAECSAITRILDSYCQVLGQTINFEKSSSFFSPNTPAEKLLSQSGREVLIKSVIQAIPSYAMQCFLLPRNLLDKLMMIWQLLTLLFLLNKGGSSLVSPDAFWGRMLKGVYFPHSNFLVAKRGSRPSWLWNSLLYGRDLLLQGVRWHVGNGKNISFWTQKWVPFTDDFYIHSPRGPFHNNISVLEFIEAQEWNTRMLREHIFAKEVDMVLTIPISKTGSPDKLIWHFDSKG